MYKVGDKVIVTTYNSTVNGEIAEVLPEYGYRITTPLNLFGLWYYENGICNIDVNSTFKIVEEKIMPKYNIGDKVLVRNDLVDDSRYEDILFMNLMVDGDNTVRTISGTRNFNTGIAYTTEETGDMLWSAPMFVGIYTEETNLVFVRFRHNPDKTYTFKVPDGVVLNQGDEVYVESSRGKTHVTCATDSFIVTDKAALQILVGIGASFLKPVIGRAKEKKSYEIKPF